MWLETWKSSKKFKKLESKFKSWLNLISSTWCRQTRSTSIFANCKKNQNCKSNLKGKSRALSPNGKNFRKSVEKIIKDDIYHTLHFSHCRTQCYDNLYPSGLPTQCRKDSGQSIGVRFDTQCCQIERQCNYLQRTPWLCWHKMFQFECIYI